MSRLHLVYPLWFTRLTKHDYDYILSSPLVNDLLDKSGNFSCKCHTVRHITTTESKFRCKTLDFRP